MPLTLSKVVTIALRRNKVRLEKELEEAIAANLAAGGTKWYPVEVAKRELDAINVLIGEWKNGKED